MFPIRDHNPSGRMPYVTVGLIITNVIIFLITWFIPDKISIYQEFALVPVWVTDGYNLKSFITAMFLHGGWLHLFGNVLFLWVFGDNVEDILGHVGFLIFYLVTGIAASAMHIIADPNSNIPLIGASGAIAGVMGAYLVLFPRARVDVLVFFGWFFWIFKFPAFVVLGLWLALQVFNGANMAGVASGVAYWAHFGGFIAGMVAIIPWWLMKGGTRYWHANKFVPPHPETQTPQVFSIPKINSRG